MKSRLATISREKVKGLLTSGIEKQSWIENLNIAKVYPFNVSLGLHPFHVKDKFDEIDDLKMLLTDASVIAVGEIGLDYYNDYIESKELQKEAFYNQLVIAHNLNLPVILHCRRSYDDLYSMLKTVEVPALIFHSFSGTEQDILRMKEFNSYFSFGFPITNENSKKYRRLVQLIPRDRLLLETDSPYMRPKHRFGDNQYSDPNDVGLVYEAVSEVLDVAIEDLSVQVERNVKSIWKNFRELSS